MVGTWKHVTGIWNCLVKALVAPRRFDDYSRKKTIKHGLNKCHLEAAYSLEILANKLDLKAYWRAFEVWKVSLLGRPSPFTLVCVPDKTGTSHWSIRPKSWSTNCLVCYGGRSPCRPECLSGSPSWKFGQSTCSLADQKVCLVDHLFGIWNFIAVTSFCAIR